MEGGFYDGFLRLCKMTFAAMDVVVVFKALSWPFSDPLLLLLRMNTTRQQYVFSTCVLTTSLDAILSWTSWLTVLPNA